MDNDATIYCQFCGKSQHEVEQIIVGPADATICDSCVVVCMIIIEQKQDAKKKEGQEKHKKLMLKKLLEAQDDPLPS